MAVPNARRDEILRVLEQGYPSRVLPHGAAIQLGREFGIKPGSLGALLRGLGWKATAQPSRDSERELLRRLFEERHADSPVLPRGAIRALADEVGMEAGMVGRAARALGWRGSGGFASMKERFWRHADRSAGPDGCWPWTGAVRARGGGQFMRVTPPRAQRNGSARRVAWTLATGEEPPQDSYVSLSCQTRLCVNPAHLRLRPGNEGRAPGRARVQGARTSSGGQRRRG